VAEPVVVDTMIASAWLGVRRSQRQIRWAPVLEAAIWVLPFVVVAEMRFGAEVAGWGARRRSVLDRLVARAGVVPPLDEVTDAYVDLRAWCVRTGHGLGAKDHEADRWVAAVAVAGGFPLATEDAIFDDVVTLRRKLPDV
jgi:predicted nucleic acid-binding protein